MAQNIGMCGRVVKRQAAGNLAKQQTVYNSTIVLMPVF